MSNLSGQIAVVTGASSGIGKAVALSLAEQGVALCLIGRNSACLDSVASMAEKTSPKVLSYPTDLAEENALNTLVEQLKIDVPQVNFLVHCAGVLCFGRIEDLDLNEFDSQYRTNVRAPYVLTKGLLPMIKRSKGQIVMMNSSIWQQARAGLSQYAGTKYALKAFADSLRDEVNSDGVRVLSMFLGQTATPMLATYHQQQGTPYYPDYLIQPSDVANMLLHLLTLPYSTEVTDIHIRPMRKLPT